METKANYVLIGAFALFGLFAAMGMLIWLAKFEADRRYAYYDILFESVSGLNQAGDVRYNGLPVGRVVGLQLDEDDHTKVRVRIEISEDTPIKADTVATLRAQGVTGVSFVSLTGGSPDALPIPEGTVIRAGVSEVQTVLEGAPVLLEKAIALLEDINAVVDDENRAKITTVLDNVASASGRLDRTLEDFEDLSADLGLAARNVAEFSKELSNLSGTAEATLLSATQALDATTDVMEQAGPIIENADGALTEINRSFQSATTLIETDLTELARQGSAAAQSIQNSLDVLLPDAEGTLVASRETLETIRTFFTSLNTIVDEDVDVIMTDARTAVNAFSAAVETASADFTNVSKDVLRASQSAAEFTGMLESILADNRVQVSAFLRAGLPEFLRLTEEARLLVSSLDRFIRRVQSDPARFFLGTQGSEFSR